MRQFLQNKKQTVWAMFTIGPSIDRKIQLTFIRLFLGIKGAFANVIYSLKEFQGGDVFVGRLLNQILI